MNIAVIDAEIIDKNKHRFPNLACMKISSYYKNLGCNVELKLNYEDLENYDKVFISKVFTDTKCDDSILSMSNVEYGGTGFFYDKAPKLDYDIEHSMPDYNLYNNWIDICISNGAKLKEFEYYTDYSLGFLTRGCFRQCDFCVNRNSKKVEKHSSLEEFVDKDRKYIALLDDNFLGFKDRVEIINELKSLNKPFTFRQGLDIRIINDEIAELFSNVKYKGDFIFAFDNIEDKNIIEEKLKLWRKYCKKNTKLYLFCAFDKNEVYDNDFWLNDIRDIFKRIEILNKYNCKSYTMRYEKYKDSPYQQIYTMIASWTNQVAFFNKMNFRTFCVANGMSRDNYSKYKYIKDNMTYINEEDYLKENNNKKLSSWLSYDMLKDNICKIDGFVE